MNFFRGANIQNVLAYASVVVKSFAYLLHKGANYDLDHT
jgi:hypothetical protein